MKDSQMFKSGYKLNLDNIHVGAIIGMVRRNDGSLHYYLDGADQGEAYNNVPATVYPVIDLYGQCAQVKANPIVRSNYLYGLTLFVYSHNSLCLGFISKWS